mmetsp:Transcript_6385/g.15677  ORF Transcript_6385/g.15677 Transcript_6385/m.15677 type:complete len:188 (-) Transcript_6385:449-1012(-)
MRTKMPVTRRRATSQPLLQSCTHPFPSRAAELFAWQTLHGADSTSRPCVHGELPSFILPATYFSGSCEKHAPCGQTNNFCDKPILEFLYKSCSRSSREGVQKPRVTVKLAGSEVEQVVDAAQAMQCSSSIVVWNRASLVEFTTATVLFVSPRTPLTKPAVHGNHQTCSENVGYVHEVVLENIVLQQL